MESMLPLESEALRALIEISKTVTSSLDVHEVLRRVNHASKTTLHAEAASLLLVDKESGQLYFEAAEGGESDAVRRIEVPLGEGVAGWVGLHCRSTIVDDVASDPRFTGTVDDTTGFRTRNILCVPLVHQGRLLGVMEALNKHDGGFDAEDLRICESIASLAAIAIDNAQTHAEQVRAARMAAVGQTAAGLAHCIKNILNGIEGGSFIVDKGLECGDQEQLVKGWAMVRRNNTFLRELVLDLLTYSKEREPEYRPCDLCELCFSVVELMSEKAEQVGVALDGKGCEAGRMVVIDPTGIRRCVLNLLSNAIDACGERPDGRCAVEVAGRDDGRIAVSISDNGCGIRPDDQRRLFQEFFSTKGSKGTGLGLAVTHKIVTEHQGQIEVESAEGRGTTFTIVLPRRPADKARSGPKDQEEGRCRI